MAQKVSFGEEAPMESQEAMPVQPQDQNGQHVEMVKDALAALEAGDIEAAKGILSQLLQGEQSEVAPEQKESLSAGVDKIIGK
jgi:tryptophan synthase beta subunit